MRIKLLIIGIVGSILFAYNLFGGKVDETIARQVAVNWYRHYAPGANQKASIKKVKEYSWGERISFYICSFDKGGFVMVSANDAVTPVLGYSFESTVPDSITNEAVKAWFDGYARQIDTVFAQNLQKGTFSSKWEQILANIFPKNPQNAVEPLVTTMWDQGWPYNAMCPANINGPGGHTWAGCVAIALAQIMKYHEWPGKGAGNLSYLSHMTDPVTVNFSEGHYSWGNMPNMINDYNEEVAKLIYCAGASVGSQYGALSTTVSIWFTSSQGGIINTKLPMEIALASFFKYNYDSTKALQKTSDVYDADWISFLKTGIDKSQPIYYQGGNPNGSNHAWVCDGYDANDFFHFNFGWSGLFNGYYSVLNIAPGANNFTSNQLAITGIMPDSTSLFIESDTNISGILLPANNLIVPRGVKLTLAPGCELKMATEKRIVSLGTIKSLGYANNIVKITAADTNARWKGISRDDAYLTYYNVVNNQDTNILRQTEISWSSGDGLSLTGLWGQSTSIDHCYFKNNQGRGLYAQTSPITLTNSIFSKNGDMAYGGGVAIMGPSVRVANNIFKGTYIYFAWPGTGSLEFNNNCVIEDSKLHFRSSSDGTSIFKSNFFYGNNCAVHCDFSSGNFVNNLFVNNATAFISNDSRNKYSNNTFSNNVSGLEISNGLANDTLRSNILYNNGNNLILTGNTTAYVRNCIIQNGLNGVLNQTPYLLDQFDFDSIFDGDPDFVNPSSVTGLDTASISNHSWNLGSNSAAIDMAGIDTTGLSLPYFDLDGNPRINRTLDVGAYESLLPPSLAPVVIISPQDQTKCIGSQVVLTTYIKGVSLQYNWFFNSTAIPGLNTDSLVINNVTISDTGSYYCIACNIHGCDTTLVAHLDIPQKAPFEIGEIEGPDTVIWWQKSVNFCVNDQPDILYRWDILGKITSFSSGCRGFMADYKDSSGLIKVLGTDFCGIPDSAQKNIVIKPFSPPEPYGILDGPSVVYRGETVRYSYDRGNYDIENVMIHPNGFDWSNAGYYVTNYALPQCDFKAHWYKYKTGTYYDFFEGEDIVLPITVVDSATQLPFIEGPDSIISIPGTVVYSIDSLLPADSYQWICPTGFIPSGNSSGRTIEISVTPDFAGGILQVRGSNQNWRGPYYEKSISRAIYTVPAQRILTGDTINNGQQQCYDAAQTITAGGNGKSFKVKSGGFATMIAGQNIVFLAEVQVDQGGYLHGYITATNEYCFSAVQPIAMVQADKATENLEITDVMDENNSDWLVKVYPNPTTGVVNLLWHSFENDIPVRIRIYNLFGEMVYSKEISGKKNDEISLIDMRPGIYLLHIVQANRSEVVKVIRN